jgi:hypothetical protein
MLMDALLPTPRRDPRDATARTPREDWRPSLAEVLLPTPRARTDKEHTANGQHWGELRATVELLPTPVAQDGKNATAPSHANRKTPPLTHALLPTPTSNDSKGSDYAYSGGDHDKIVLKLPGAVKSIGEPTPEESPDGKKSPAPLLNPCFVAWMLGAPEGWSDPNCPLSAMAFKSKQGSSSADASLTSSPASPPPRKAA